MNSDFKESLRLREFLVTLAYRLCDENKKMIVFVCENKIHTNIFHILKPIDFSPNDLERKALDDCSRLVCREIDSALVQECTEEKDKTDFICIDWHLKDFRWEEETNKLYWPVWSYNCHVHKRHPAIQREEVLWEELKFAMKCPFENQ